MIELPEKFFLKSCPSGRLTHLFRMVFREKKELLSLYNAINGTNYDDPEALTITTIEDAIYMGMKNDVSFILKDVMNLYEGQASWNPNMPQQFSHAETCTQVLRVSLLIKQYLGICFYRTDARHEQFDGQQRFSLAGSVESVKL